MKMAYLVRERSTCLRRAVGAVMVKDARILSTGYNGAPKGLRHCEEVGCIRADRGVHAEQNAVIQAAVFGVSIKHAILYGTNHPCSVCAKILVNADIKEIVYSEGYADDLARELIEESGITVRQFKLKPND